jgi:tRNA dimethylallyltransferase
LRLVVVAYESEVDFSAGVVAALRQGSAVRDQGSEETAENARDPLVAILLGPTGSGKTALSLELAQRFDGEIVSCDSVAVYRGMELGTAKPSVEERARVPHHLIDVTTPEQPFTAGEYSRLARAALGEITGRGPMPIVTGGTGLYLRALTEGLFAGPARQENLRKRLLASAEKRGSEWLHRMLARLDAETAKRIHANDKAKVIRAIEVCVAARKPMSEVIGRDPLTGFKLLRIGLNPPRERLYERLNARCAAMFAAGLVEETRGLLEKYGEVKALDSLGYRQALAVLNGSLSEEDAVKAAQQGHRNFAKRQMTWFRREPEVEWIGGFGNEAETMRAAAEMVESALTLD